MVQQSVMWNMSFSVTFDDVVTCRVILLRLLKKVLKRFLKFLLWLSSSWIERVFFKR